LKIRRDNLFYLALAIRKVFANFAEVRYVSRKILCST